MAHNSTPTITKLPIIVILILLFLSLSTSATADPTPAPWPVQFHAVLIMNYNGTNQLVDLWYDWVNGRNFNIIHHQLGNVLYDLEWNNGTSFFYTLDSSKQCRTAHPGVGILRPNWLDGATFLGQRSVDGFLCNVWEKADFITYYEDVVSKRPVHWVFYTGRAAHVMTFEFAALGDSHWQAPEYCFGSGKVSGGVVMEDGGASIERLSSMRLLNELNQSNFQRSLSGLSLNSGGWFKTLKQDANLSF